MTSALRRTYLRLTAEPAAVRLLTMVLALALALSRTSPFGPIDGGGGL